MRTKVLLSVLVLLSLLASCNLPISQAAVTQPPEGEPVSSGVDRVGTAVALTAAAQLTQTAAAVTSTFTAQPTITFTPTPCSPLVTATVNANVRSGPDTAYGIVGSLTLGQTAMVVGRNDAYTWWYIAYPGAAGGHAWIAGSVVTSACVPSVVQVVAAPPLPTAVPTEVVSSGDGDGGGLVVPDLDLPPLQVLLQPDLIVSEFTITPATPVMGQNAHVRIGVYNQGNAASGPYTVRWYGLSTFPDPSCSWTVDKSNANGGRILQCDFVFQSWYPINKTSVVIVDANNQVNESDEGNNQRTISPFGVAKP